MLVEAEAEARLDILIYFVEYQILLYPVEFQIAPGSFL